MTKKKTVNKAVKTATKKKATVKAVEKPAEFQTDEFRTQYEAAQKGLEEELQKREQRLVQLEERAATSEKTAAQEELKQRKCKGIRESLEWEISDAKKEMGVLRGRWLDREKQALLDRHMSFPCVCTSEWVHINSDRSEERMIVANNGLFFLLKLYGDSHLNRGCSVPTQLSIHVQWAVATPAAFKQMTLEELEAIVEYERKQEAKAMGKEKVSV